MIEHLTNCCVECMSRKCTTSKDNYDFFVPLQKNAIQLENLYARDAQRNWKESHMIQRGGHVLFEPQF